MRLHPAQVGDVPAAAAALLACRHHPEAYGYAVALLDAAEEVLEQQEPGTGEWLAWAEAARVAEAAARAIERATLDRPPRCARRRRPARRPPGDDCGGRRRRRAP